MSLPSVFVPRPVEHLPGLPLCRAYPARRGQPIVDRVDPRIFTARYFGACMRCTFCHDSCCQYGADVDLPNARRLLDRRAELEPFIGRPATEWLEETGIEDPDFPGGRIVRTRATDGGCVFLNRNGRGCLIHSFALSRGEDYHDLKPLVCWLFPLTVSQGLLHPSDEIAAGELVCMGDGPTLYDSLRDELAYTFGAALVAELDALRDRAA